MKTISTLTLTGQGTQDILERGKLLLEKGRAMMSLRLRMTAQLTNNSGTARALTDAERQAFLDGYVLNLTYGRNGRRRPYNMTTFTRVQKLFRFLAGSEWEGYNDTVTGLARTLPNNATTTVQLDVTISTGRMWMLRQARRLWGVGRTQAKTMQAEVYRRSDVLPTGFSVAGNVSFDVIPEDVSRKGPEVYSVLPEWVETDETDKRALAQPGCVLLVVERSTTLAASALSNIRVAVDMEELYSNMSVQQAFVPYRDIPNYPSEADISDREAVLYAVTPEMELRDLLSGQFILEQTTKTLAVCRLGALIIPLPADMEVREEVADAAGRNGRNKTLKAVSAGTFLKLDLPHSLVGYMPWVLLDTDDKEFGLYPGQVSEGGRLATPYVPATVLGGARALHATHAANGEMKNAEDVSRQVAAAVPGAQQDTKGFAKQGSPVLDSIRTVTS